MTRPRPKDAVSDTVVRALERRDQFRGEASLGTWLHQILHHLVIDRARRHPRELSVGEVEDQWRDQSYTVDPAAVAERAQERAELHDALLRLPFGHRVVVVLHDAGDGGSPRSPRSWASDSLRPSSGCGGAG